MTGSWFGNDTVIIAHLLKLTLEVAPIVKDNKLRTRILRQPGIMKQILDGSGQFISGFNNLKPSCGWIYHSECQQKVFLEWCLYSEGTHQINTNHDPGVRFCFFGRQ